MLLYMSALIWIRAYTKLEDERGGCCRVAEPLTSLEKARSKPAIDKEGKKQLQRLCTASGYKSHTWRV